MYVICCIGGIRDSVPLSSRERVPWLGRYVDICSYRLGGGVRAQGTREYDSSRLDAGFDGGLTDEASQRFVEV